MTTNTSICLEHPKRAGELAQLLKNLGCRVHFARRGSAERGHLIFSDQPVPHAWVAVVERGDPIGAWAAGSAGSIGCVGYPFQRAELAAQLERQRQARALLDRAQGPHFSSSSTAMQRAVETIDRAGPSSAPVLLRGESGTGKGVLARRLHQKSARSNKPFVVINCPTLSEELLAAELFGHARGAFTGAVRDRPGRVELADGGTVLLDELGDLPPALQVKLLRFLQDKEFERLGESRTRRADVRLIAATNRDLEADVASGRFRLDLYYRISVVEVKVPALRDRPEDLLSMARHLLAQCAEETGRSTPSLDEGAERALLAYSWPGNVRELRNELERAMVLNPGIRLTEACFSDRLAGERAAAPLLGGNFTLAELEWEHIERVLARAPSYEAAAHILGIDDTTLWRKRKRVQRVGRIRAA